MAEETNTQTQQTEGGQQAAQNQGQSQQQAGGTPPAIDYDKLAAAVLSPAKKKCLTAGRGSGMIGKL